jgi:hypothetical protein
MKETQHLMENKIKLSEEEAEQLFGEIDNQGFGYWVEHYGYDGEEDPELVKLCEEASEAMSKLREHIDAIWEHYDIG